MTLSLTGISQRVGGERWLYRDLDLEIQPASITAVIGPNGSGKSTLLRQLVGIDAPERGTVSLGGVELSEIPRRRRATRIAFLPQHTPLYYDLRVRDVVMLGRAPHLGRFARPSAGDERAVDAALEQVELGALAERGVFTLSGGERQRVMVARLLATGAGIMVLDEPTTSLDIGHALGLLELCQGLARREGRSVIIAMHELELARRYADEVLCLTGDGDVSHGSADAIMTAEGLSDVFGVRVEGSDHGISFFQSLAPETAAGGCVE